MGEWHKLSYKFWQKDGYHEIIKIIISLRWDSLGLQYSRGPLSLLTSKCRTKVPGWEVSNTCFLGRSRSWLGIQILKRCHFRAKYYLSVNLVRTLEFTGKEMEALGNQVKAQDQCLVVWRWDHLVILPLLVKYFLSYTWKIALTMSTY